MSDNCHVDINLTDKSQTSAFKLEAAGTSLSFTVSLGKLLSLTCEEEGIIFFGFEKGEMRIELALEDVHSHLLTKKTGKAVKRNRSEER